MTSPLTSEELKHLWDEVPEELPGRRRDDVLVTTPGSDLHRAVTSLAHDARVDGAAFILDGPREVQAVWGDGEQVAWSAGEPLLINGPSGVGKTTIAQQVTLARLGIRSQVLGLPVAPDDRRVLYIAADRPPQAARSFRRMVSEEHRDVLAKRLEVWRGPLPIDLTKQALRGQLGTAAPH